MADKGLVILGVHIQKKGNPAAIREYVSKNKIPFIIALDTDDSARSTYEVGSIPRFFVIDPKGSIVWQGDEVTDATRAAIEKALSAGS